MMVTGYIVIHVYIVIFFPCYLYVQDKVLLRFPPAVQTLIIIQNVILKTSFVTKGYNPPHPALHPQRC